MTPEEAQTAHIEANVLAHLGQRFPRWHVWVAHQVLGRTLWCARLIDGGPVLAAETADGLERILAREERL
jgi:hypothetical protein